MKTIHSSSKFIFEFFTSAATTVCCLVDTGRFSLSLGKWFIVVVLFLDLENFSDPDFSAAGSFAGTQLLSFPPYRAA